MYRLPSAASFGSNGAIVQKQEDGSWLRYFGRHQPPVTVEDPFAMPPFKGGYGDDSYLLLGQSGGETAFSFLRQLQKTATTILVTAVFVSLLLYWLARPTAPAGTAATTDVPARRRADEESDDAEIVKAQKLLEEHAVVCRTFCERIIQEGRYDDEGAIARLTTREREIFCELRAMKHGHTYRHSLNKTVVAACSRCAFPSYLTSPTLYGTPFAFRFFLNAYQNGLQLAARSGRDVEITPENVEALCKVILIDVCGFEDESRAVTFAMTNTVHHGFENNCVLV